MTANNNNNNNGDGSPTAIAATAYPPGNLPRSMQPVPGALRFEAQRGDPSPAPSAQQQNVTTENLLGLGCVDPRHLACDRARMVKGVFADTDGEYIFQMDYPTIGSIGQIRAVLEALFAFGKSEANPTQLVVAGATASAAFASDDPAAPWNGAFPWSIGFRLDWGVALQFWAPFNINLTTDNWVGDNQQVLDRSFTVRNTQRNGGVIYAPWAMSERPPMAQGLIQLALPIPQDEEDENLSTIQVTNLPAAIAAAFSAQVSFLTAASPQTLDFATTVRAYGEISSAA